MKNKNLIKIADTSFNYLRYKSIQIRVQRKHYKQFSVLNSFKLRSNIAGSVLNKNKFKNNFSENVQETSEIFHRILSVKGYERDLVTKKDLTIISLPGNVKMFLL